MKYAGMPMGMWMLFRKSFRDHLVSVLSFTETEARRTAAAAKPKYREIIGKLPEFEKADRFKMNMDTARVVHKHNLSGQSGNHVLARFLKHLNELNTASGRIILPELSQYLRPDLHHESHGVSSFRWGIAVLLTLTALKVKLNQAFRHDRYKKSAARLQSNACFVFMAVYLLSLARASMASWFSYSEASL